jgi:aldose sugar dehydrogenase
MTRSTVGWSVSGRMIAASLMAIAVSVLFMSDRAPAQTGAPAVLDRALAVDTVVTGLALPTAMAFIGNRDVLVLEKGTGKVQRITNGALQSTPALDLAVNFASERGLLGIALHPQFPRVPWVYLYWTESTAKNDAGELVDTDNVAATPLLGNRVDRFVWNGSTLRRDINLIQLRAIQTDAEQQPRGNHNAGVLRFEVDRRGDRDRDATDLTAAPADADADAPATSTDADADRRGRRDDRARLFIIVGDEGRRGQLQNLANGPFGAGTPDDQFGGPEPDDAHLSGVILRLNDDGTTPEDNPFFSLGRQVGGEVGENVQKIFAYGIRNSFGMAVDPRTGELWNQENGDDSFDEINRVSAGQNNGWVQIMGPVRRVAEFKAIETSEQFLGLQQVRWPPSNIADTPQEALSRLFRLRGSHYRDPQFSWKFAIAPAAIGFLNSRALGRDYEGDLFVGASRPTLDAGYLLRFNLSGDRRSLEFSDRRLADRVADNRAKFDATESESLRFGTGFGIGTDIHTGPNGNLFVLSLTNGALYEIRRAQPGS